MLGHYGFVADTINAPLAIPQLRKLELRAGVFKLMPDTKVFTDRNSLQTAKQLAVAVRKAPIHSRPEYVRRSQTYLSLAAKNSMSSTSFHARLISAIALAVLIASCPAMSQTSVSNDPMNQPFLIGNGVTPDGPYPCDVEFGKELAGKRPWPFSNLDLLYYPHRVEGLDSVYPENIAFIAKNLLPYSPGLIFSGATVQHGDVTFRPEDGPKNLGLAQPFNRYSIARQIALLKGNGIWGARHLSLSGMILEELPPGAKNAGWYANLKEKAIGPILAGHIMVNPNYQNPDVRDYLADTFATLTSEAGYHYFWMDNWFENTEFYPKVYGAVRSGAERNGGWAILRSGAGPSQVGLTDILAPSPDIQHTWSYVRDIFTNRVIESYVRYCPNAFKLGFDDFYINEPFTRDQARFLATLYGIPGMEITITEGEFFKTPPERISIIEQILPLPVTGPLQRVAPTGSHIWIESIRRPFGAWHVAAFFNESSFDPGELSLNLNALDTPTGPVLAWDFWDRRFLGVFKDKMQVKLGPASCLVVALRPVENRPQLLSTDRHILQGAEEITNARWDELSGCLSGVFTHVVAGRSFTLYVHVPGNWKFMKADGRVKRVKKSQPEILKVSLAPDGVNLPWRLDFKKIGGPVGPVFTSAPVTNTLGELVVASTAFSAAWTNTAEGMTIQAVIASTWKAGHVRVLFTRKAVVSVRVNGVACPRVENPARRFTAWYTTEGESTFAIPPEAVRWGEPNRIVVTPKSMKEDFAPGTAGLQLDLSSDP